MKVPTDARPSGDHPTQELPTLQPTGQLPTQELTALDVTALRSRRPRRWFGRLVNAIVTVVLLAAVTALLVVDVMPLFLPYRVYTVLSGSMGPTIPVGSEIILERAGADQIRTGDVITFSPPGHADQLVTHRVMSITTDSKTGIQEFITKGDANAAPDEWRVPAQGSGLRYLLHVPYLGYAFALLQSPAGRICFVLAPSLLLLALLLSDMRRAPQTRDGNRRPA